ncbi:MAG TPA: permease-like cell division protein FtsX, partial [Actinomycetes bacterium]|nr:permease-like cell division protein FtsX [Actinomycetes bacterium]
YWFGKTDVAVFLEAGISPAERAAIRERIASLAVADRIYHESQADAYARFKDQFRSRPDLVRNIDPSTLPESFRVLLDDPGQYPAVQRALCPRKPDKASGSSGCMDGVDTVIAEQEVLAPLLLPKAWTTSTDVSVFLPAGATAAQREAVRARLQAIDGVATVTWESPDEVYRRLPEKLRRNGRDPARAAPLFSPGSMPGAFHVTLDGPARVQEFHRALCGSRTTGECAGGLVVLEHPRKRG